MSSHASALSLVEEIHSRAVSLSIRYRRIEFELIDVLLEVDQHRVYLKRGHPNLFQYVTSELGLSESVAYSLIGVARKVKEVPELRKPLAKGELTLTNARRIVPLLSAQMNESQRMEWIQKASELSARQLEKEIVMVRPELATREHARYTSASRVELQLGLSEKEMLRLRRVQDLLSQSKSRPVSLEESLQEMVALFLERKDPVQKAKRHQVRKGSAEELVSRPNTEAAPIPAQLPVPTLRTYTREPIPAAVIHAVNLRDEARCVHIHAGERCRERRWTHFHHRILVSKGGLNTLENLVTLCSTHHKLWHLLMERGEMPQ